MNIISRNLPVIIKSSPWKLLWLLALLGAMLALSIGVIPNFWGWLGTIILCPFFLITLYIYRPSANYLRLHRDGLDISTAGRLHTINWLDVVGFHIADISGDKKIGILYTEEYLLQLPTHLLALPHSDGDWIRDLYAIPLNKLCDTLNCWAENSRVSEQ